MTEEDAKAVLGSEHACRQACRNIHMYIYQTNIYHTLTNAYTQRHTKRVNQTNPIFKVIEALHSIFADRNGWANGQTSCVTLNTNLPQS